MQKALIDMENMFDLLNTRPAVEDVAGARPLVISQVGGRGQGWGWGAGVLQVGTYCKYQYEWVGKGGRPGRVFHGRRG